MVCARQEIEGHAFVFPLSHPATRSATDLSPPAGACDRGRVSPRLFRRDHGQAVDRRWGGKCTGAAEDGSR
jgi:hypothetical protein